MAWSEGLEWSRVEIVMLMMMMMLMLMMMTIMHLRLGFLFGLRDEFCIKLFYILFCTRMN